MAKLCENCAGQGKAAGGPDEQLDSEIEAHLCQLAMMENYASHGMYVKFSDDEARALEDRSLQLAIQESEIEEEARRSFSLLLQCLHKPAHV